MDTQLIVTIIFPRASLRSISLEISAHRPEEARQEQIIVTMSCVSIYVTPSVSDGSVSRIS